jgi:glutamate:Na+ symporter, ESS family
VDFSASNTLLWFGIIQFGILGVLMLAGNTLRRKIPLLRKSLLPTAVIGGFIALFLRQLGWLPIDKTFLESMTYHMTAIGFIALALRAPTRSERGSGKSFLRDGINSGAFIVSNYLIQGVLGLLITIFLSVTFMPDIFKAAGLILPLGYGQGPGQAYNIGNTYEQTYGFAGGASFGLAIATMGTLWACIGGIIYLNLVFRRRRVKVGDAEQVAIDQHQEPVAVEGEIPLTEAVDKFTIQIVLVLMVYLMTYLISAGITKLFDAPGMAGARRSVVPLVWGFNFLIGSSLALAIRGILDSFRRLRWMNRQYNNGYMLNRISGSAFDLMIFASIAAIDISDLRGLWLPFVIMATVGGFATLFYIHYTAKVIYPGYFLEGMVSMYGMMTGTVSTGILLLREVDPAFRTPAANNLVVGSSAAIVMGFPMLLMLGLAPQSNFLLYMTLAAAFIYAVILNIFLFRTKLFRRYKEPVRKAPAGD